MTLTATNEGQTHIIAIEGWLDTRTAPELQEQLEKVPASAEELLLDLTELEYISSAGIRQLVAAYKQMDGKFRLKGVRPEILDVLKLTGLNKKFTIE